MEAFETIDEGVRVCRSTPNAVLLDVRTPEEYATGHIPGSVNHPLESMQTYDGDVSAPIFAYCRSGPRRGAAEGAGLRGGEPRRNHPLSR